MMTNVCFASYFHKAINLVLGCGIDIDQSCEGSHSPLGRSRCAEIKLSLKRGWPIATKKCGINMNRKLSAIFRKVERNRML